MNTNAVWNRFNNGAGFGEHIKRRFEMRHARAFQDDIAAGRRYRKCKCAGFDAIRHNSVDGAFQAITALNAQDRGADAVDHDAHFDEAFRDVADFRFARRVLDHRLTLCESGSKEHLVRGTNRDFRKNDVGAS